MPFFIVFPPAFGSGRPGVTGPFLRLEDAEAAHTGHRTGAAGRVVEAADRRAAETLARQAWPHSPDT